MATMETTDAPQVIEHQHQSLTFTPYETRWVPVSARFVCCGISPKSKGVLQVYELKGGKMEAKRNGRPRGYQSPEPPAPHPWCKLWHQCLKLMFLLVEGGNT